MITFDTSVRIERPVDEVFAFVSDPLQLPRWNSAVQVVRHAHGPPGDVGSTYSMERDLPGGRVHNELEIFARESPAEFGLRTRSGPTPFAYRYAFRPDRGATLMRVDASVELPRAAALLGPVATAAVKRGVATNFADLKRMLEQAP